MTTSGNAGNRGSPISPTSKKFLVFLFADLRKDLNEQEPGAAKKVAIYDALLEALNTGNFPDNETLREYVAGLAKATDEANGYERAALEHRALAELVGALGAKVTPAVDE